LEGARALVVGGGSGIGYATARCLAIDGARVTIAGRTKSKLLSAQEELGKAGLEIDYVACDACDGSAVRDAVDCAGDDGCLDIAVVVPGGGSVSSVLLYRDDQFSNEVDGNVRPVYLTLKYAGRAMVKNGSGSFVAISSTAAVFSARYLASYSAGKAAVDQLVRVAANELGPFGVRVNSIQPGLTRTPTTDRMFANPKMLEAFLAEQPLLRHGEPEDIAQAVRYMAGPESAWVTGQLLTVDGGNTLRSFIDYADVLGMPDMKTEILRAASAERGTSV
jgi:NAD(P)-dependent dehydrogenase (short-subunit alcohol dehydrogenase family)